MNISKSTILGALALSAIKRFKTGSQSVIEIKSMDVHLYEVEGCIYLDEYYNGFETTDELINDVIDHDLDEEINKVIKSKIKQTGDWMNVEFSGLDPEYQGGKWFIYGSVYFIIPKSKDPGKTRQYYPSSHYHEVFDIILQEVESAIKRYAGNEFEVFAYHEQYNEEIRIHEGTRLDIPKLKRSSIDRLRKI